MNLKISARSLRSLSGTWCNAYEQQVDGALPRIYTHPARDKRNRHPYTQTTSAHCALRWWNMAAALKLHKRQVEKKKTNRHIEAAFQSLGSLFSPEHYLEV